MNFSDSYSEDVTGRSVLNITWQQHAQVNEEEYPLAANAVKNHCYMDEVVPSVDSLETAKETRRQLSEMGEKASFHICKWCPIVRKCWKIFLIMIVRLM